MLEPARDNRGTESVSDRILSQESSENSVHNKKKLLLNAKNGHKRFEIIVQKLFPRPIRL